MKRRLWLVMTVLLLAPTPAGAEQFTQFTVARNDKLHESFSDVAIAANGDLVVAYQESESHGGGPVSAIVTRASSDQGRTWGPRTSVVVTNRWKEGWLDCPKIIRLQDKSLMIVIGWMPQNLTKPPGAHRRWWKNRGVTWLYRSFDNGRSWKGPEKTSVRGGIVPSLVQLRDGTLLIGITSSQEDNNWRYRQVVYRSGDNGKTWTGPVTVGMHPKRQPCEGDFVELDSGEVVCYMRDEEPGVKNGLKAISSDGGRTWSQLYGSGPWVYRGRPDVGLLSSGEVMLTVRIPNARFAAYVETQKMALAPAALDGPTAPGAGARVVVPNANPDRPNWGQFGWVDGPVAPGARAVVIDTDTNPDRPDWGYSGWVELPDGSVYAVQYITADAPATKPFIRGYLIPRSSLTTGLQK